MTPPRGHPRQAPRRILFVRLSALGDVIVTLGALRTLRQALPRAVIDFAVQDELAPVLEGHPDLDRVVPVPVRHLRRLARSPLAWPALVRGLAELSRTLQERCYDCVLDTHGNLKSGLVTWLSGAPLRVGTAPGECREGNDRFMTAQPRRPVDRLRHRRERALALLPVIGLEPLDLAPAVPAYPREWARAHLGERRPGERHVLLHPGASPKAAFKRWPTRAHGTLARELAADPTLRVWVTAGPGEEGLVAEVVAASGGAAGVLPTPPGLRELGGLLSEVDLLVAADSGPAQLADACGTPTVVLFGPKDPRLYGPRRGVAVRLDVPCGPCGRRSCPLPRVECLEDLGPGAVVRIVRAMLEGRVPPGTVRAGAIWIHQEPHEREC